MRRQATIAILTAVLSGAAVAASQESGQQTQSGSQQSESQSQTQGGGQQAQDQQKQTQGGGQQAQDQQKQPQGGGQQGQQAQEKQTQGTGEQDQNQASGSGQAEQSESDTAAAQRDSGDAGAVISTQSDDQILAQDLIDTTIMNNEKEEIGSINDLILDKDGRLSGVIVGVGGFLGIGEKNVGLSWSQIEYDSQKQTATVKVSKAELEKAPGFKTRQEAKGGQW